MKMKPSAHLLHLALLLILVSCTFYWPSSPSPIADSSPEDVLQIVTPIPPLPETIINFRVEVPANTPPDEAIYLSILDEVTGLALNSTPHIMQPVEPSSEVTSTLTARTYTLSLPFAIGSVVQYRYERQAGPIRVAEHLADGNAVRYRLYYVQNPGSVEDVVSRWTDTPFDALTGRIIGQATDNNTGQPIPNLLVAAGGAQTFTTADGSFLLEELPPGVHNLVAYAPDGSFSTFQQGARVADSSTTHAPLTLVPNPFVKVMFIVKVPEDTPPIVPLRLAGNLIQLGNTFASLTGGISSLAVNMPTLGSLPDGRYYLTMTLPVGVDIRYKYTLGDGFWNAEHTSSGDFRLRQVVVPNYNILVEDVVDTWYAGSPNSITFDVYVPVNTPVEDFISIQFNPLFGWTEPIPMWQIGENRWAYVLYSPLNLPGNFSYRYCRNGQCGRADDVATPGQYGAGRPIKMSPEPQAVEDQVTAWNALNVDVSNSIIPTSTVTARGPSHWAGVEFQANYHPSWKTQIPDALDKVQGLGANWLVLSPTWTFGRNGLPLLQPVAGNDPLWYDLVNIADQVNARGLNLALHPTPRFPIEVNEWWQGAQRDLSWWQIWFDQYRTFALHHADLAARTNASALILGGNWLDPALPGGTLVDGTPSGVPVDAEARWRNLLGEVRSHYDGTLLWALPYRSVRNAPPFMDAVDQIYLLWPGSSDEFALGADLEAQISTQLENVIWPIRILLAKPFILATTYPSDPDLQTQVDTYNALLKAANQRDWISGFISRGFYPPAALQDTSASINGKPVTDLLAYWFPRLLTISSP